MPRIGCPQKEGRARNGRLAGSEELPSDLSHGYLFGEGATVMVQRRKTSAKVLSALALVLAGALLLISPGQTRADILLTIVTAGTPSGSNFLYTYDVMLLPGSVLHVAGGGVNSGVSPSNNFFTLYDIPGFVAGSVAFGGGLGVAGNSSFTTQNSGVTSSTEIPRPTDD